MKRMRNPNLDPRPGDRFRCKNGSEYEASGAVVSVTKSGKETRCLWTSRVENGVAILSGVSTIGVFRSVIRRAAVIARGSDEGDPWANAERRAHSDF
jgi:hypothetical protein